MTPVRLALAALPCALLAGCFLLPKEEERLAPPLMEPPQIAYATHTVERGTIVDDFTVSGTFEYTDQQNLSFRSRGGWLRAVHVRSGDRVKAGPLLAELETDELELEVARQQIALRRAQLLAEQARLLDRSRIDEELAALDVQEAEIVLAHSRADLAKARLLAPADGVVVYLADLGEGDAIEAWQTLLRLADPRTIGLVYTGERASSFAFGARVEVTWHERRFEGTVIQTTRSPGPGLPAREEIVISVRGLPASAEAGDLAEMRVELQRRSNVIVIPRNLIQRSQGSAYVDVLRGGVKQQQPVEVGLETWTQAEIVKGLAVGDTVIVR